MKHACAKQSKMWTEAEELSASCEKLTGLIFQLKGKGNKTYEIYEINKIEPGINERRSRRGSKATAAAAREQKAFRMSKHKQFSKRHDAAERAQQRQRERGRAAKAQQLRQRESS